MAGLSTITLFTSDVTEMIDGIVDSDMRAGNYYKAIKKQADYRLEIHSDIYRSFPRKKTARVPGPE